MYLYEALSQLMRTPMCELRHMGLTRTSNGSVYKLETLIKDFDESWPLGFVELTDKTWEIWTDAKKEKTP